MLGPHAAEEASITDQSFAPAFLLLCLLCTDCISSWLKGKGCGLSLDSDGGKEGDGLLSYSFAIAGVHVVPG